MSGKNFADLQKARSVKDISTVVNRISSAIESVKETPFSISLSASTVLESGDILKKRSGNKTFDTDYSEEVSIPKNIKVDADLANRVRNFIAELDAAKTLALSPDFSRLASTKALIASIEKAKREASVLVKTQMRSMNVSAKEHVPPAHKNLAVSVAKHLEKILDTDKYTDIKRTSYVVPDKGLVEKGFLKRSIAKDNVVFQTLIKISDLVDEEGYAYPLTIVLTSRLEGSKLAFYVTSIKSDRVPGTFPVGTNITSFAKLRMQVNALLSVDGFVGKTERKPIGTTTSDLRKTMLTEIEGVSGARVAGDTIVVKMEGLSKTEKDKTIQNVMSALNSILKTNNKATLRHKVTAGRTYGVELLKITMGPTEKPSKLELTAKKAKAFASILGLEGAQARAFINSAK